MFDELTGKVLFPDAQSGAPSTVGTRTVTTAYGGAARHQLMAEAQLSDAATHLYVAQPLRSISTVDSLEAITSNIQRPEEHFLWKLMGDLLRDAERTPQYRPSAMGLDAIHPSRTWYISQHAHIQTLLMKNTFLRRCTTILRWLEHKHGVLSPPVTQRPQQSATEHDAVLLRTIVLSHLRSGRLDLALLVAESAKDALYCCVLSASEMQTEQESWYQSTELVPLFGEYGQGEVSSGDHQGANNDHRLTNLGYLYEDSLGTTQGTSLVKKLDALIAATLSGNAAVLALAFADDESQPQWQHRLWATLRSALVSAFSKALVFHGADVPSMKYLQYLDRQGRTLNEAATWDEAFSDHLFKEVVALLHPLLETAITTEEQLQIRVILQFLDSASVSGDASGSFLLTNVERSQQVDVVRGYRWMVGTPSRLVSHVLLVLDLACSEHLLRLPLQGLVFAEILSQFVATLQREDWLPLLPAICGMVLRLESPKLRAKVFGTFIFAQRVGTLERGATKASTEDQEAALLQYIQRADPNPAVHDGIVEFLNTKALDGAHSTHLLKNNPECEALMWEAMRADSPAAALAILQRALYLVVIMWQRDEVDAVATLVDIVRRLLLPKAVSHSQAMSSTDADQLNFWDAVLKTRQYYAEHIRLLASMKNAGEGPVAYRLKEVPLRGDLLQQVRHVLRFAPGVAAVHRDHIRTIAACCAWSIRSAAEAATLVFTLTPIHEAPAVDLLQTLFGLVEAFDRTPLMSNSILARADAEALFSAIRTARGAFGMRRIQVRAEMAIDAQK
ncbi:Hypothetical protein, putative [Bodo saltans]|uniref:Nuclear pore complex protein n=1 Tax=Bodo saltans TaxID=75058 RepID=A0A0S4J8I7_BODSA|nr:Hypothetical protein, putative [Bodo saltans]|eukprot:CUG86250.1 Hypothetical protein, putative [Bodo saltans]